MLSKQIIDKYRCESGMYIIYSRITRKYVDSPFKNCGIKSTQWLICDLFLEIS